jgi:4-methyl-5(b-hydroxyethyl)-thiazole monophosphate biosynthesis
MLRPPRRVLVPVARGSEDVEVACLTDVLRRASFDVTLASIEDSREVVLARGLRVVADSLLSDSIAAEPFDVIALPGGMPGAERLRDCPTLISLLRAQQAAGRWTAAICAAPAVVLAAHGLLDGAARATCYPSFAHALPPGVACDDRVVVDEAACIITSRGPGTAVEFALRIVGVLDGKDSATKIADAMLLADPLRG